MSVDRHQRILVVEDELHATLRLVDDLAELGLHIVGVATTADEAVHLATTKQPDLVMMDIRLGQASDGIEAAARIKAERVLPIIFVTGAADAATHARAHKVGPVAVLMKPFSNEQLLSALSKARQQIGGSPH
jgi:CheY-like chemotaxis protein